MLEMQRPEREGMWWRWNSQVEKALWRSLVMARCVHLLWRNEGQKWRSSHGNNSSSVILHLTTSLCVCEEWCPQHQTRLQGQCCICIWCAYYGWRREDHWEDLCPSVQITHLDPPNALVWNSFRNEDKKYRFTRNHISGQKRNWKHKEKRPLPFYVSN